MDDYKRVMFDEDKRLNGLNGDTALTLSQLSARNRDSTFGSTYVAQSTSNTLANDSPAPTSRGHKEDEESEDEQELKKRIARDKLDLDELASIRKEKEEDRTSAPRTPKQEATELTNRSMESNKSYMLSRASSSKK